MLGALCSELWDGDTFVARAVDSGATSTSTSDSGNSRS